MSHDEDYFGAAERPSQQSSRFVTAISYIGALLLGVLCCLIVATITAAILYVITYIISWVWLGELAIGAKEGLGGYQGQTLSPSETNTIGTQSLSIAKTVAVDGGIFVLIFFGVVGLGYLVLFIMEVRKNPTLMGKDGSSTT